MFTNSLKRITENADAISDSLLAEYCDKLDGIIADNLDNTDYKNICLPIIEAEKPYADTVFLSIVMRTQGRRPETLREALLCLSAQTDGDFEILLCAHKVDDKGKKLIEDIVAEQMPELREKIRVIYVDFGGRCAPLNVGFAHARGTYVAIHDDDDITLANWVETFHVLADKQKGTPVLHSPAYWQDWSVVDCDGADTPRAEKSPYTVFGEKYNAARQIFVNACPPIGLAFPRRAFCDLGFIFDDTLSTVEDWDYLMKVSAVFGAVESESHTCFYRKWVNYENASTVCNQKIWDDNRDTVWDRLSDGMSILSGEMQSRILSDAKNEYLTPDGCVHLDGKAEYELGQVMTSVSWKIGRLITYIPRNIYEFCLAFKKGGFKFAVAGFVCKFCRMWRFFAKGDQKEAE